MESNGMELNKWSVGMVDALTSCTNDISWAAEVNNIYESLRSFYRIFGRIEEAPDSVFNLGEAVEKLENYLFIDLARHIATQNGRRPYYLACIQDRLRESLSTLRSFMPETDNDDDGNPVYKKFDHLTAHLHAAFVEYGFCKVTEILYESEEIMRKLEQVSYSVDYVEELHSKNSDNHEAMVISELHNAMASLHGIQQAITEADFQKVGFVFDRLTERMLQLENSITINKDSPLFRKYVQSQIDLKKESLSLLCNSDATDIINHYTIHPGTRIWLLERIARWYNKSANRVFYFSGWKGSGMTAISSTLCKLYGSDVIACHFFNSKYGESKRNSITGLLESLSSDMCKTLPQYSKYISETYGSELKSHLNGNWKDIYNILFKTPLKSIFGKGDQNPVRRQMVIIDGLDQIAPSQLTDVKQFLTRFVADFPARFCIFVTAEIDTLLKSIDVRDDENVQGVRLDEKPWIYNHIKDLEIYVASSLGAILSGEDEVDIPFRARADSSTLQNTVDNMVRLSAGRFDFAMELMATFANEMSKSSGQFLSSLKKSTAAVLNIHGEHMENLGLGFSSFFSSYRFMEGRSVTVRILRKSSFPLDKTRVALIRAHHKMS